MSKLFIKRIGIPETEWGELSSEVISDSISLSGPEYVEEPTPKISRFQFTFRVNMSHKTFVKLGHMSGLLKRPRLTYKTIKRDCAKRNR